MVEVRHQVEYILRESIRTRTHRSARSATRSYLNLVDDVVVDGQLARRDVLQVCFDLADLRLEAAEGEQLRVDAVRERARAGVLMPHKHPDRAKEMEEEEKKMKRKFVIDAGERKNA